jgi:hypothetical protein
MHIMDQQRQGVNIFGYWLPAPTMWVIIILLVTLIGGVISIVTANTRFLPIILGLLLATALRLLFKLMVRESRRSNWH